MVFYTLDELSGIQSIELLWYGSWWQIAQHHWTGSRKAQRPYRLRRVDRQAVLPWSSHRNWNTVLRQIMRSSTTEMLTYLTDSCSYCYWSPTNLEYECPAWHTSLTKEQTKSLVDIQRWALQVIIASMNRHVVSPLADWLVAYYLNRQLAGSFTFFIICCWQSEVLSDIPTAINEQNLSILVQTNCHKNFFILNRRANF